MVPQMLKGRVTFPQVIILLLKNLPPAVYPRTAVYDAASASALGSSSALALPPAHTLALLAPASAVDTPVLLASALVVHDAAAPAVHRAASW